MNKHLQKIRKVQLILEKQHLQELQKERRAMIREGRKTRLIERSIFIQKQYMRILKSLYFPKK